MIAHFQATAERIIARVRQTGYPEYPWWIPVGSQLLTEMIVVVAVAQRWGEHPFAIAAALGTVTLLPWFVESTGRHVVWPVYAAFTVGGSLALTVFYPVDYDIVPLAWAMMAGKFGATERPSRSIPASACVGLVLLGLGLSGHVEGTALWVPAIILGWDIGFVMQYQQRKIESQARSQAENEARAVLEERQRIAREVHDVIAHSLSVTMLHLTAARRDLEEEGEEGIGEAIEALRDAEKQGRQAMSDIRHTVGLLGQAQVRTAAPDIRDLPRLVQGFRDAGLRVDLDVKGDLTTISTSSGLGLYRIVQESLTNIAKHQPDAHAGVALDVRRGQHLVVWNDITTPVRRSLDGAGINGMAQRADLLGGSFSAGVQGNRWVVELDIPTSTVNSLKCFLGMGPGKEPVVEPAPQPEPVAEQHPVPESSPAAGRG